MEAEVDGTAAAKQVSALQESVSKLCVASGSVSINQAPTLSMCPVASSILRTLEISRLPLQLLQ